MQSTLLCCSQQHTVERFRQANDGHGAILFREIQLGGHTALIGLDTGCEKSTISQQFLDRFHIPSTLIQVANAQIDTGAESTVSASHRITLPLFLKPYNVLTEFLVLPRLAAPLDALLSWSWLRAMKVRIDCANNDLTLHDVPAPEHLCDLSFGILQPRMASASSNQLPPTIPLA
jgi:hypothetical protein